MMQAPTPHAVVLDRYRGSPGACSPVEILQSQASEKHFLHSIGLNFEENIIVTLEAWNVDLQPSWGKCVSDPPPRRRAWLKRLGYSAGGWGACCKNDDTDASNTLSPHLRGATHHRDQSRLGRFIVDMKKKLLPGPSDLPPHQDPPLYSYRPFRLSHFGKNTPLQLYCTATGACYKC